MTEERRRFNDTDIALARHQFLGDSDLHAQKRDEVFLTVIKPFVKKALDYFDARKDVVCDYLQSNSNRASRPYLCAQIAKEGCRSAYEFANEAFQNQHLSEFAALYDFHTGGFSLINWIMIAEAQISGTAENNIARGLDINTVSLPLRMTDKVDVFLQMERRFIEAERLLIADPTGFNLLEGKLEEIKKYFSGKEWGLRLLWLNPCSIPVFTVAGAEFAQKVYRRCYQLPNSRPSAP